jgi:two-component system cell cycle response regulator DivK
MAKILIVDDEVDNLELLSRRLTRRGFEVLTAGGAADGLARARADRPQVILMDVKMPDMDGYEATRRLKADEATHNIPVVVLTAQAMPEDRDRALEAGADEYESKPVDLARLLEKIGALLERAGPGG